MTSRRKFIQGAAVVPAAALATPALAQETIRWRMQTYAGPSLAAEVIVPAVIREKVFCIRRTSFQ